MEIIRIYNNNVVVTCDENNNETVAIGKGIAFQKKAGDIIDEGKIEKIFTLKDKSVMTKLELLVKDMPSVHLEIAEAIVEMIHQQSDLVLNENIYLTLIDHINLSLEREKQGIILENPLLIEIKQFYPEEFSLAKKSAGIIKEHAGVSVSEDEMGFITLHIVNASMNQNFEVTMKATRMIPEILDIVEGFLAVELDRESVRYSRFVRHLQFFVRRVLDPGTEQEKDNYFYKLGSLQFPEAYECVNEIGKYVKNKTGKVITKAEKGYMIYHIINMTEERNGK